jgi:hypothetical protein
MNPIENPEAYHTFTYGGLTSPGIVGTVSGWKLAWKWDKKTGKGSRKGTITHTGQELSGGSFTVQLWLPEHFAAWERFVKDVGYNTDKKPAVSRKLYYPTVGVIGVVDAVLESISPYEHAGKGLYKSTFEFSEWAPAPKKNATVTPQGSAPSRGPRAVSNDLFPPSGGDPIADQQQAQIAALLAEAQQP